MMFRRLLARFSPTRAKQHTEPEAPFIPIRDEQGRVTGMMDHHTATYLQSTAPDPSQAALDAHVLFGWFGSGQGPWSGFPMYEQVAEQLLLDFPTDALVEALTQHQITPTQLEGAARYFAGWGFRKHKPGE